MWYNQDLHKPLAIYSWQRFTKENLASLARNGYIGDKKAAHKDRE